MPSKKKTQKITVINPHTDNPISLTPEIIKKAEQFFRAGMTDNSVANILGINPRLFREWLIKGGAYGTGLHGELYVACARSIGTVEFEMIANIRKAALGSPAEYAYNTDAQGNKTVALDGEGRPIIAKAEVPAMPQWSAWILEKRFKRMFGKVADINIHSIIEENPFDAALNSNMDNNETSQTLSTEDEIAVLEMAIRRKQEKVVG